MVLKFQIPTYITNNLRHSIHSIKIYNNSTLIIFIVQYLRGIEVRLPQYTRAAIAEKSPYNSSKK